MITGEGCDKNCRTCNMMQQTYCATSRLIIERTNALAEQLTKISERIEVLNSELLTAQGGTGAVKGAENEI